MRIAVVGNGPAASTFTLMTYRKADIALVSPFKPTTVCAGGIGYWALRDIEKNVNSVVKAILYKTVKTDVKLAEAYVNFTRDEYTYYSISNRDLKLPTLGVVIDRVEFDLALLNEATNHVIEASDNFNLVVDARGYVSQINVPKKDLFVTGQYWIETKDVGDWIRIRFWKIPTGYFWEFPEEKNGVLKVGVGVSLRDVEKYGNPKRLLDEYVNVFNVRGKVIKQGYKVLPLAKPLKKHLVGKEVRIGTAGLLVDPLTGAGIRYAIVSACVLSECIGSNDYATCYAGRMAKYIRKLRVHYTTREWIERKGLWGYDRFARRVRRLVDLGVWRAFTWIV